MDDQVLMTSARRLGVAVPRGRHTVRRPSGVSDPSVHTEGSIQIHILLINLQSNPLLVPLMFLQFSLSPIPNLNGSESGIVHHMPRIGIVE